MQQFQIGMFQVLEKKEYSKLKVLFVSDDEKRADYKNQHSLLSSIGWTFKGNTELEFVEDKDLK